MTTDRELLELAAKAAGIRGHYWKDPEVEEPFISEGIAGTDQDDCSFLWAPHLDDGEALRLATWLRMAVGIDGKFCEVMFGIGGYIREPITKAGPYADVRRAIVRAAAEIGRRMP